MSTATPTHSLMVLGCVNSYLDPIRKDDLRQERRGLRRMWERSTDVSLKVEMASPGRGRYFFDLIRNHRYNEQVAIVHLAGYAINEELYFESGLGMESVRGDAFAQMLGKLPELKLVFLNGCASVDIMQHLFRKDIPIVIAMRAVQERSALHILSRRFYQHLASGDTIASAFDKMRHSVEIPLVKQCVPYDLDQDCFSWPQQEHETFAQGLYVQEDQQHVLDWHLSTQIQPTEVHSRSVEEVPESPKPTRPKYRLGRLLSFGVGNQ